MYQPAGQIKAARACTINGHVFAKDDVLTAAQVAGIKRIDTLLSGGLLVAVPDPSARRLSKQHRPSHLVAQVRRHLGGKNDSGLGTFPSNEDEAVTLTQTGRWARLDIDGGVPPFTVDWGDGSPVAAIPGTEAQHVYALAAHAYTATLTDSTPETFTKAITTQTPAITLHNPSGRIVNIAGADVAHLDFPVLIAWGEGGATASLLTAGDAAVSHTYGSAGAKTVTATDVHLQQASGSVTLT